MEELSRVSSRYAKATFEEEDREQLKDLYSSIGGSLLEKSRIEIF